MSIEIIDVNDVKDNNEYFEIFEDIQNLSNDYLNELEYNSYNDESINAILKITRKDYDDFKNKLNERSWVYSKLPKIFNLCCLGYDCFDDNGELIDDGILVAAYNEYSDESIIFHSLVKYMMHGIGNYWFILYVDDGQFVFFDYKMVNENITEMKFIELH